MPGSSGLEAARVVRTYQPNVPLLFLTAYPEYAAEGYKVAALRYLYKDHLRQELPDALDCALKQIEMLDKACIKVQHYQNYTRVFLRDILYVHKENRTLQIVTSAQGTLADGRGIRELFEEINDSRFIFIDRACFVNLEHIEEISGELLILTNRQTLSISRPMASLVKDAFLDLFVKDV